MVGSWIGELRFCVRMERRDIGKEGWELELGSGGSAHGLRKRRRLQYVIMRKVGNFKSAG